MNDVSIFGLGQGLKSKLLREERGERGEERRGEKRREEKRREERERERRSKDIDHSALFFSREKK